MKVLFDQGTPVPLRRMLGTHVVVTAYEQGWSNLRNGDLLRVAEDGPSMCSSPRTGTSSTSRTCEDAGSPLSS